MSTVAIRDKDRAVSIGLLTQLESENTSLRFQVEKLTLALRHASSGGGSSSSGANDEIHRLRSELDNERARREELEQRLAQSNGYRQAPSMAQVSRNAIELEIDNLQKRLTETRLAMSHRPLATTMPQTSVPSRPQQVAPAPPAVAEDCDRDDLTLTSIIKHLNEKRADRGPYAVQQPQWRRPEEEEGDLDGRGREALRDQDARPAINRRRGASYKNSNVERLFQGLPTKTASDQGRRRR